MKVLLPLALSFLISSCPQPEELPRNFLGLTQKAEAQTPELDRTLGTELHFASDSVGLSRAELESLDAFLRTAAEEGRIREMKVILWLPRTPNQEEITLVRARVNYLGELLRAHRAPFEILMLESSFYEDSQGSLLAILD